MEKSIEYTYLKLSLYFLSTKHFLPKFSGNFDACACNPFQAAPFLDGAWFEASYDRRYPTRPNPLSQHFIILQHS